MNSSLLFTCSSCGAQHKVRQEHVGKTATCNHCGHRQVVSLHEDLPKKPRANPKAKRSIVNTSKPTSARKTRPNGRRQSGKNKSSSVLPWLACLLIPLGLISYFKFDILRNVTTETPQQEQLVVTETLPQQGQPVVTEMDVEEKPTEDVMITLSPEEHLSRLQQFLDSPNPMVEDGVRTMADKIDTLVISQLEKMGLSPNPEIDDRTFLRRIYLSLAGRLPNVKEQESFFDDVEPSKRSKWISNLLDSPAHASHQFNFWADILRIWEVNQGTQVQGYIEWVKSAIEKNMPYDQFVYRLIAAEGNFWDDQPIGFYIRDKGMALDHMALFVRTFLGTRIECAQCHDHPFDKWTQKEFYELGAHTFAMRSHGKGTNDKKFYDMARKSEDEYLKEKLGKVPGWGDRKTDPKLKAILKPYRDQREVQTAGLQTMYKWKKWTSLHPLDQRFVLKLPHDYQYDNAKPLELVKANTIFDHPISQDDLSRGSNKALASWVTSRDNPMFTKVIANRMWEQAFGKGFIQTVDKFKEKTQPSNPELLEYLTQIMEDLDFDIRAFQEVIYNTKIWQRAIYSEEISLGKPHYHQGPTFQRMSAEQIWDSLVHLMLPNRDTYQPKKNSRLKMMASIKSYSDFLEGHAWDDFLKITYKVGKVSQKMTKFQQASKAKITAAHLKGNKKLVNTLKKEMITVSQKMRADISNLQQHKNHFSQRIIDEDFYHHLAKANRKESDVKSSLPEDEPDSMSPGMMSDTMFESTPVIIKDEPYTRSLEEVMGGAPGEVMEEILKSASSTHVRERDAYRNTLRSYNQFYNRYVRASELVQPSQTGGFLRIFGQSDRENVSNESKDSTIPQSLMMMNGEMVNELFNDMSLFKREIDRCTTTQQKIKFMYQSLLTREPSSREVAQHLSMLKEFGQEKGLKLSLWAILNTKQFLFIE